MEVNFLVVLGAALVPMVVGFIWYHKKVFGTAWMKAAGVTEESAQGANMALIFGVTFVLSILLAFTLQGVVIHQFSLTGFLNQQPDYNNEGSESRALLDRIMGLYGNSFRTFKHGALHGALSGVFFAVPILGINALFERKGFKYIAVNGGYWIVTLALMGGVICAFA